MNGGRRTKEEQLRVPFQIIEIRRRSRTDSAQALLRVHVLLFDRSNHEGLLRHLTQMMVEA